MAFNDRLALGAIQAIHQAAEKGSRIAEGVQAIVIALKSRTQNTREAVADTMESLEWLKEQGAEKFYLKYCSTFDSTPQGNIGPVADAAMEFLGTPYTVLCPALPRLYSGQSMPLWRSWRKPRERSWS